MPGTIRNFLKDAFIGTALLALWVALYIATP